MKHFITIAIVGFCLLFGHQLYACAPFECDGSAYIVNADGGENSYLYKVNTSQEPFTFEQIGSQFPFKLNALGYNPIDNFLYAVRFNGGARGEILRIGSDDCYELIGNPFSGNSDIPTTVHNYDGATFLEDGTFVVSKTLGTDSIPSVLIIEVDGVDTGMPTVNAAGVHEITSMEMGGITGDIINDIVVSPNNPTQLNWLADSNNPQLFGYDVTTGTLTVIDSMTVGDPPNTGSQLYSTEGELIARASSGLWFKETAPDSGTFDQIGTGPLGGIHDGASCPFGVNILKTVMPESASPGDVVTYTFQITNQSNQTVTGNLSDNMSDGRTFVDGTIMYTDITGTENAYGGTSMLSVDYSIAANTTATISIDVQIPSDAGNITLYNQAVLTASGYPPMNSDYPTTGISRDSTPLVVSEALPVELAEFNAERVEKDIRIHWATLTEINNDYFLLQYSFDGIEWTDLHRAPGQWTSTAYHTYSYLHEDIAESRRDIVYYRLHQVDLDGEINTTHILAVNIGQDYSLQLRPTVVSPGETLTLVGLQLTSYNIVSINGQLVRSVILDEAQDVLNIRTDELTTGMYFITFQDGRSKKFIIR